MPDVCDCCGGDWNIYQFHYAVLTQSGLNNRVWSSRFRRSENRRTPTQPFDQTRSFAYLTTTEVTIFVVMGAPASSRPVGDAKSGTSATFGPGAFYAPPSPLSRQSVTRLAHLIREGLEPEEILAFHGAASR